MSEHDVAICTVGDLIEHLQKNFKPEDKLCRWFESGAYMNCEHILKDHLGDLMFTYVKHDREKFKKMYPHVDDLYKDFDWINDNDVLAC